MILKLISKFKRINLIKNFQCVKMFVEGINIQLFDIESGFLFDVKILNVKLKFYFRCWEFGGCINFIWFVFFFYFWIVIKNFEVVLYDRKGGL